MANETGSQPVREGYSSPGKNYDGGIVPCKGIDSRDWYAWLNLMPPPPDDFHVVGEVYVPNPGVVPYLVPHVPPGINPVILLLDLVLLQLPGVWPAVFVWKPVRYDKIVREFRYEQVQVLCGNDVIADIPIEIVQ